MKLGMSILVRDEVDIIEDNIRFHAEQGVAQFVVTDNGSVDGTREILADLAREFPLEVFDEPRQTIDQDIWVTRMAYWLRDFCETDWVINNDSDEFWIPKEGNLIEALSLELRNFEASVIDTGVLHCKRFNYLPAESVVSAPNYHFSQNKLKVLKSPEIGTLASSENVLITDQGTKVMCKLDGLTKVEMGNHDAAHSKATQNIDRISIAHYPLRTYQQFEKKVFNHGSSIARNTRFGTDINWHLRRWFEQLEQGELEQEYQKYVITKIQQDELVAAGVLIVDSKMEELIRNKMHKTRGSARFA